MTLPLTSKRSRGTSVPTPVLPVEPLIKSLHVEDSLITLGFLVILKSAAEPPVTPTE